VCKINYEHLVSIMESSLVTMYLHIMDILSIMPQCIQWNGEIVVCSLWAAYKMKFLKGHRHGQWSIKYT